MPAIEDHGYLRICAQLANTLSISLSSARRRVELVAARDGIRDLAGRKSIAEELLKQAQINTKGRESDSANQLDKLLEVLAEDENFMVED